MKITGTIKMIQTPGRTDRFVKKQLPNDYFLALEITDIDGSPISTLASVFNTLKPKFPSVQVNNEEVSDLFETYKLAAGMTDVCHLSLAYFGDFRIERNTDNDLDEQKIKAAYKELDGQEVSFEIDGCPFQIVSTSNAFKKINTEANVTFAPVVGNGRDTIVNLLPGQNIQEMLSNKLSCVFGEGFKIWNSQKKEIPFHVTIAQTDKLNLTLAARQDNLEKVEMTPSLAL
ncbi:hypothetical protein Lsan_3130 [Legionella santicrucis]|uniref:Uncharacterized protein n=1 Tax=Legionella santicrucis TaxID=45074 RepID=A0A0W0YF59_9GAMM|nr:hypothetical protein [Legionella santicrucis]KTD55578.1 hypothetical protein Lsan_3130 [Legionella santicrucis]